MNASEQLLCDRISQFSFDDGDEELTFVRRLALENGWTEIFAARVIDEYKRFVFLAVVANHPVTPSDQVDQAWHLHLTYTESYWDKLCGQIIGTPLHHGPTRGGAEEARKYYRWYRNTLESYGRFFGRDAPADIWPDASARFGENVFFQRLNTKQHWVILKTAHRAAGEKRRADCAAGAFTLASVVAILSLLNGIYAFPCVFGFIVFMLLIGAMAVANDLVEQHCPQCKKNWVLKKTGVLAKHGTPEFGREEWKCKNCGYSDWRNKPPPPVHTCGGGCGGG